MAQTLSWLAVLLLLQPETVWSFRCVPVARVSEYCSGMMPQKVCGIGDSVDGVGFTSEQHKADVNVTCPKNPALFTQKIFCQGPWLPCVEDKDCGKQTHKRCYDLCMNGGKVAGRTFLGANQCAKGMFPQQYCNARVSAAEVAPPGEKASEGKCLGLTDYQEAHGRQLFGHTPFVPEVCQAKFPLYEFKMADFGAQKRKEFMLALADKLNTIWGIYNASEEFKFVRPTTLRARRIQVKNSVISIFVEAKQFCAMPFREGKWVWTAAHGKATNEYCDVPGPPPHMVFQNLSIWLNSRPVGKGMQVGDFWIKQSYMTQTPQIPSKCFPWEAEEEEEIPPWVWSLTALGSSLLLLSLLILQHRWRNSVSRVRGNERLRSYM